MRAARFDAGTRTLEVQDVPIPVPGPSEVLVKVEACGICLSDVHLLDGTLPAMLPQVTPGHEAAGTVEAVGAQVPGWTRGDQVVLAGGRPCGTCHRCVRGLFEECAAFADADVVRDRLLHDLCREGVVGGVERHQYEALESSPKDHVGRCGVVPDI